MLYQAHKGVSSENPENTMPAFESAVRQGYRIIELDVSVTKDLRFVLLHDKTINRTARYENGDVISQPVNICDITYAQALEYDFGIWFAKKFRGTKIPLWEEVLSFAKRNGILLKIDNKYQRYSPEQKEAFFALLQPYADTACLTCSNLEELELALSHFPQMHFHYDGAVTQETLSSLSALLPMEQLTVWLPHQNPATAWVKVAFADAATAQRIKKYARLGIWILSRPQHLADALALGADVIETNGQLKPMLHKGFIADMHTHSEHSHDSVCPIADMYQAQKEKGTSIFAVTDHFDTHSFLRYDVFTPIQTACQTVSELNKAADGPCVLKGIEISEGFWHKDIYEKAAKLTDYDVVIGSVHLVRYKELTRAYSALDFSVLSDSVIAEYVDAYFDDMLTMLEIVDFDILAHLTCPLRYILGKYQRKLELSRYEEKIEKILAQIIQKGIALEVNTSSFDVLQDFMPSVSILKKYHDMGGYLITLGSDAHTTDRASGHFSEAIAALKAIGFPNIYYYKNRNPYPISIQEVKQWGIEPQ